VERLVTDRDTLMLFGPAPTAVPIRALDREGLERPLRGLRLELAPGGIARVRGDSVQCTGHGTAQAMAALGGLEAAFVVRCRPQPRFRVEPFIELSIGDRPHLPLLEAIVAPDTVERLTPVRLTAQDTIVARIRAGRIEARAVGRTRVDLDAGGVRLPLHLSVRETIARETLVLSPGESRSWRLAPGRYEIAVGPVRDPREFATMEMSTEGLRCVRDRASDALIHCVVDTQGAVTLENRAPQGPGRQQRASVAIIRAP